MPKRLKPEDAVKNKCLLRLEQWKSWGVVLDYDDVSNLGRKNIRGCWIMHTTEGKRDIIALIAVKNMTWVYLIEVKAPSGGNWSKEQQEYAKRFSWQDNVIYEVVTDHSQIDITLDRITDRTETLLKEF